MPSTFVQTPMYPDVPIFPGVPPLLIAPGLLPLPPPILAIATALGLGPLFGLQWGIFDQMGSIVIESDSVFSMEYSRDYHISNYPQEQGAFESYNKVQLPYRAKVTFIIAGTRSEFLNTIEAAVNSLDLFVVVTPEIQYYNANLTHYGYRREARDGVTMISVDVWCEEVRTPTQTTFGNTASTNAGTGGTAGAGTTAGTGGTTQSSNATPTQQDGIVQPQDPISAQTTPQPEYTFYIPGTSNVLSQGGAPTTPQTRVDTLTVAQLTPQIIPLAAVPSQTLFTTLNNQACQINIFSKDIKVPGEGGIPTQPPSYIDISPVFCDLYVNGAVVILGVLCLNSNLIVRDAYLGFIGDLAFWDTQGTDDPLTEGLGQRWQLVYWPPGTY